MRKGTTPTHIFTIPTEIAETLSKIRVIYSQNNEIVLTKDTTEVGSEVKIRLTQEETLQFDHSKAVDIQVRALTLGGDALNSDIMTVRCEKCLEDGVFE